MVEAEGERIVDVERAAEAHAAHHRERVATFEQQTDDLQEVLVPAHRDAVFGDAAEPGHHAIVERLVQGVHVFDRLEGHPAAVRVDARQVGRQGFDLETVDADDAMPVVHQVVRQREACRPHAGDQHLVARRGERDRAPQIERVPAREQAVDLEAPGQFEHVLQRARLGLRDVDRRLLLVDAGLHAVVADAVAGGRDHRVVDGDQCQRRHRVAARLDEVEFGDPFLERTAGQLHTEDGALVDRCAVGCGFVLQAFRAGVLALRVAPDAVVRLVERSAQVGARIREREAIALTQVGRVDRMDGDAVLVGRARVFEQRVGVDLAGVAEQHAVAVHALTVTGLNRPRAVTHRGVQAGVGLLVLLPVDDGARERELLERSADPAFDLHTCGIGVESVQCVGRIGEQCLAFDELPLRLVQRREFLVAGAKMVGGGLDAEQRRDEGVDRRSKVDQEVRFVLGRECIRAARLRRCARGDQTIVRCGVARGEPGQVGLIEGGEPLAAVEILETQSEAEAQCAGTAGGGHQRWS